MATDPRLLKLWAVCESLLLDAAARIPEEEKLAEFRDYLSHNELEMALEALEDAALAFPVDEQFGGA